MSTLRLGIDIGTSGIRTAVVDAEGTLISMARASHVAQGAQINATGWWDAVKHCISEQGRALADHKRSLRDIGHIAVDGTSGSMVLTDAQLVPVTQALMYNSTGFDAEAALIAGHAPAVHITRGANSALARALRLQGQDSGGQAVHLLHQADFVMAHLVGRGGVSDVNNALKLGYDPETRRWPDWFAQTGLRMGLLPDPNPAGAAVAQISPVVASALGFAPGAQIHAGTTDSIAAFLAAAPLAQGAAVTSLGTTLAVKILSPTRIDDPAQGMYSHKVGDFWLAGGASNTGGGVLADLFSPDDLRRLSRQIDPTEPSPLDYYPLRTPGERFPINDPDLPPRMTPRPADDAAFLHGLLEGIARIEARCYGAIKAQGGPAPVQLFTAGGGAANETWTRIRTRVLGIAPQSAPHTEAAIGVARLIQ